MRAEARSPAHHERVNIVPMTPAFAAQVATWRYPQPYDVYDVADADPDFLVDPTSGFHALVEKDELIGFRSFGDDGQVPGGPYESTTPSGGTVLDTGGGLRPDLTGRGLGGRAIATGLLFGLHTYGPDVFRVTVAAFNGRAHQVVESLGFVRGAVFEASADGRAFVIFTGDAPSLELARWVCPAAR
jgi:RimJ/RimL family protein N-acetyltransferase